MFYSEMGIWLGLWSSSRGGGARWASGVPGAASGGRGLCPRGGAAVGGGRRGAPGAESGGAGGGREVCGHGAGVGLVAVRGVGGGCELL